ncbi:MAG: hypothetical protein A2186_04245 [Candidatus Levybacteria bacterium RIFOXYA1_FULL_41_10]|nr:MAG: hypothetical protein UU15_C0020G0011 [Candidatus Levybacteria bacterium GW2011_GWC2_40_7]KKR94671.1 MAG: hypothetical protein UU45_C0008G0071 [Candidatus Levybacteria bacterium GW2011_GWA2_41_15]KKS00409.1 MAG: hypothetical protein UU52_C0034G0014 [Candidatus Levybacteria bacterium GW2011_GWB1_41_21]OGH49948.1 MAG: hypothetical protein A3J18_03530 [Candidatus Levybacteria bacterium RIFCSPLOWO2_02_FULL_40_18]OGH52082.1 MAG: hypothetical protein A3H20_03775 [Candidatus Levybacteria bacter
MKLPSHVKPIPGFLNWLYPKGFTPFLLNKIYLNNRILRDLETENPKPHSVSILIHEQEHLKRRGLTHSLKYALLPKHRLKEELRAYKKQFVYLKSKGEEYDIENVARKLSGPFYLFAADYKRAKKLLEDLWQQA